MSKHLVRWARPVTDEARGHVVHASKCGRFEIRKRPMASARNGCWNAVAYVLKVIATGKTKMYESLYEAKVHADWEIDPDWDTES